MSVRVFLERVNWGGKTGTHADGAWTGKKETRGGRWSSGTHLSTS